jgi:hypothetical protein
VQPHGLFSPGRRCVETSDDVIKRAFTSPAKMRRALFYGRRWAPNGRGFFNWSTSILIAARQGDVRITLTFSQRLWCNSFVVFIHRRGDSGNSIHTPGGVSFNRFNVDLDCPTAWIHSSNSNDFARSRSEMSVGWVSCSRCITSITVQLVSLTCTSSPLRGR